MRKPFFYTLALFIALNLAAFSAYRVVFLARFVHEVGWTTGARVILAGARLDLALLGFELSGLGLVSVALGRLRLRGAATFLGVLTTLHGLACTVSLYCYQERGQQLGEILIPYITQPRLVALAVTPFLVSHAVLLAGTLAGLVGLILVSLWLRRLLPAHEVRLRATPLRALLAVILSSMPLLGALEPVSVKRTNRASGWSVKFTHSKLYSLFPGFAINQAVENPIHETFRVYLPAALRSAQPFQLTEERALQVTLDSLGRKVTDPGYPLLTTLRSDVELGLENIVLIEVEGLTRAIFERTENGRRVMPFLTRLAAEGLDFTNAIQSFNATSGSVFATATSMPSGCFDDPTQRFAAHELKGVYGSLPRLLEGQGYEHYFCLASRHSAQDFPAFFRNQGFTALGYAEFSGRIRAQGPEKAAGAEDGLGVVDSRLLEECAAILRGSPGKVCMHIVTNTSHSPWQPPESFGRRFTDVHLNTFAYVDRSIESFVEELRQNYRAFSRTLFVIVADHTSIQVSDAFLDRLRIPLIFWSSGMGTIRKRAEPLLTARASHVDVLPTALWLLGGERNYAGTGRSLLDPEAPVSGVVSGNSYGAFYLKGQHVLEYAPGRGGIRLHAMRGEELDLSDIAGEQPELVVRMREELLARLETAKRLGAARRVWPVESAGPRQSRPAR